MLFRFALACLIAAVGLKKPLPFFVRYDAAAKVRQAGRLFLGFQSVYQGLVGSRDRDGASAHENIVPTKARSLSASDDVLEGVRSVDAVSLCSASDLANAIRPMPVNPFSEIV